jgi:hypothetical protein
MHLLNMMEWAGFVSRRESWEQVTPLFVHAMESYPGDAVLVKHGCYVLFRGCNAPGHSKGMNARCITAVLSALSLFPHDNKVVYAGFAALTPLFWAHKHGDSTVRGVQQRSWQERRAARGFSGPAIYDSLLAHRKHKFPRVVCIQFHAAWGGGTHFFERTNTTCILRLRAAALAASAVTVMTNADTCTAVTVVPVGGERQAVAYEANLATFMEGVAHDAELDNSFLESSEICHHHRSGWCRIHDFEARPAFFFFCKRLRFQELKNFFICNEFRAP